MGPNPHRQEVGIPAAKAAAEIRYQVDCQIFDERIFSVSSHGIVPVAVQGEDLPRWGYHPVNNTIDIINPYKMFSSQKYHYKSWGELKEDASIPTDRELEEELVSLLERHRGSRDVARDYLQSLSDELQVSDISIDPAVTFTSRLSRPGDTRFENAVIGMARKLVNATIIKRIVRRVRVVPIGISPPYDGRVHRVIVQSDGQSQRLPPNPIGMVIPGIGHPIYPEMWRTSRIASLSRKPFPTCQRPRLRKRPEVGQTPRLFGKTSILEDETVFRIQDVDGADTGL